VEDTTLLDLQILIKAFVPLARTRQAVLAHLPLVLQDTAQLLLQEELAAHIQILDGVLLEMALLAIPH